MTNVRQKTTSKRAHVRTHTHVRACARAHHELGDHGLDISISGRLTDGAALATEE